MKKIQLSDGMPSNIRSNDLNENELKLTKEIMKLCQEHQLSYVSMNKALYLADKELYIKSINQAF